MRVIRPLLLIGAAIAAPSASAPRIIGGTDAVIEDYPFMASIFIYSDDWNRDNIWSFCGGSLITTRSVLTAAHCFFDTIDIRKLHVRLGSSYWRHGGDVHSVESVVQHPKYRAPELYNDVAIMKLATPAILSDRIALARIAGLNYFIPDNTTVTAIGWGVLGIDGETPEILQEVYIRTVNHDICRKNYAEQKPLYFPNVTSEMRCAGTLGVGDKSTCGGDSGGPLLHQGVVLGLTSWGYYDICAHPIYPGVYVNVPSFTRWIVDNA